MDGSAGVLRRRAEIIVAGAAVLNEILAGTGLPCLYYSTAGVRDGIIAELAGLRRPESTVGWQQPHADAVGDIFRSA